MTFYRRLLVFSLILLLAACKGGSNDVIVPTLADPQALQTAIVLTQNAPPPGFESAAFDPIDYNREKLPGVYFEVTVNFEGQYTATGEPAIGSMIIKVEENNLMRTRRVILQPVDTALSGNLTEVEAVRFSNDFYIVDKLSSICTKNNDSAVQIASLNAANIVGGFTLALPTGRKDLINGYQSYQYGFARENLTVNIFSTAPSAVEINGGEVWILPDFGVVGRFGVAMTVHNAKILFGSEPVTGILRYEYNLYTIYSDSSTVPNIAIPNGC